MIPPGRHALAAQGGRPRMWDYSGDAKPDGSQARSSTGTYRSKLAERESAYPSFHGIPVKSGRVPYFTEWSVSYEIRPSEIVH